MTGEVVTGAGFAAGAVLCRVPAAPAPGVGWLGWLGWLGL